MKRTVQQFRRRRGFSLIEVLLASFILGIGLIMVATIFPVGADWTRQAAEDTIAQTISRNAIGVLRDHYSSTGNLSSQRPTTTTVAALPGFGTIPIAERTYQFGNTTPFPAPHPSGCTYYWTALGRIDPSSPSTNAPIYDVYILVFRKGEAAQLFTPVTPSPSYTEVTGVRDAIAPTGFTDVHQEPTLIHGPYAIGASDTSKDPPVSGAYPPIGFYGIGEASGTVFRQVVSFDASGHATGMARPELKAAGENVIYAPAADGTSESPLVYVFQTTMTF